MSGSGRGRLPQAFLDDVLARVDVVDVVERYVPLKRAGTNYVACCPFHSEKSPSFTVSPSKQFYHCFGCGAHGNAIGFLMEYAGYGFIDSVKQLAGEVGLEVPAAEESAAQQSARRNQESVSELLSKVAVHFCDALKHSEVAVAFAKSLGMNGRAAADFRVGYDSGNVGELVTALGIGGLGRLVDAGLVRFDTDGSARSVLAKCLVIPVIDPHGAVCGFAGMDASGVDRKLRLTNNNALGDVTYAVMGVPQARKTQGEEPLLIVENPFDMVVLSGMGVPSLACPSAEKGVSKAQLDQALRLCQDVVVCDEPTGHAALRRERTIEAAAAAMKDGRCIRFLDGVFVEDPDRGDHGNHLGAAQACVTLGREEFLARIKGGGCHLSKVIVNRVAEYARSLGKAEASEAATRLLELLSQSALYQHMILREVCARTGLNIVLPEREITFGGGVEFSSAAHGIARAPAPVKKVTATDREAYVNFALLCAIDPASAECVPVDLVDDFSALISAWFAVSPNDAAGRRAALGSLSEIARSVVNAALDRSERLYALFDADAVHREVDGLISFFERQNAEMSRERDLSALLAED